MLDTPGKPSSDLCGGVKLHDKRSPHWQCLSYAWLLVHVFPLL
jgi:hypothetical protein